MSKYSKEFKLEVVNYYINNNYHWEFVAKKFNIPLYTTIKIWVYKYKEHGTKGLTKNLKSSYSGEFNQNVIEYMHKNTIHKTTFTG